MKCLTAYVTVHQEIISSNRREKATFTATKGQKQVLLGYNCFSDHNDTYKDSLLFKEFCNFFLFTTPKAKHLHTVWLVNSQKQRNTPSTKLGFLILCMFKISVLFFIHREKVQILRNYIHLFV